MYMRRHEHCRSAINFRRRGETTVKGNGNVPAETEDVPIGITLETINGEEQHADKPTDMTRYRYKQFSG
jgi:hypothetical protein